MRQFALALARTFTVAMATFSILAALPARAADPAPADPTYFTVKVLPIFEARCISCHGAEKPKGKLRMDTAEGIIAGGENGPMFVAGKSAESLIVKLISKPADDPDIMPAKGDPLTAEQIATISAWIDAGAGLGDFKVAAPKEQNANAASAESTVKMAAPSEVKPYDGGVLAVLAKNVQPAAPEAVKAIADTGALTLNIDRTSPLLSVNFQLIGQQVADDKLAALAQAAPQITWLNLANTKVTDAGLAALAGLPNLTVLHLERTGITDAGLEHLKGLQYLEYLNVYGTGVSDAGLATLEGVKSLKKLYTWQSKVTPEGVNKIKATNPALYVNNGIELAAAAPEAAKTIDLALFHDEGGCCAKAKAEGKECDHPCCVEARAAGKLCEKCNALGAKKIAALEKAAPDSCCAKAKAEGKLCDHDCCKEALAKGELCTKCNPAAAPAPAPTPEPAPAPVAALTFDPESCCAKAKAEGGECIHPCCVEAKAAGKVCDKCNPIAAAAAAAPAEGAAADISLLFDKDGCCATAKAGGKDCDHACCVEAKAAGKVCPKCNPKGAAQQNVASKFDKDSCCDKALVAGKACDHPCCVESAKNGQVCKQCNPKAA